MNNELIVISQKHDIDITAIDHVSPFTPPSGSGSKRVYCHGQAPSQDFHKERGSAIT